MDPQQQFFQALSALREGNLQRCEDICELLLGLNPREVNTLRLRAQVWERRGEHERGFKPSSNFFRHCRHCAKGIYSAVKISVSCYWV